MQSFSVRSAILYERGGGGFLEIGIFWISGVNFSQVSAGGHCYLRVSFDFYCSIIQVLTFMMKEQGYFSLHRSVPHKISLGRVCIPLNMPCYCSCYLGLLFQ